MEQPVHYTLHSREKLVRRRTDFVLLDTCSAPSNWKASMFALLLSEISSTSFLYLTLSKPSSLVHAFCSCQSRNYNTREHFRWFYSICERRKKILRFHGTGQRRQIFSQFLKDRRRQCLWWCPLDSIPYFSFCTTDRDCLSFWPSKFCGSLLEARTSSARGAWQWRHLQ